MRTSGTSLRVLGMLLIIVVIAALPMALAGRSAGGIIFSKGRLSALIEKRVFDHEVLARMIHKGAVSQIIAQQKVRPLEKIDPPLILMSSLDPDKWDRIFGYLIPQGLVAATIDEVMGALFSWLNSSEAYPQVVVDTRPILHNVQEHLPSVVEMVLSTFPPCNQAQVDQIKTKGFPATIDGILPCVPPAPYESEMKSVFLKEFSARLREAPSRVNVTETMEEQIGAEDIQEAKEKIRGIRRFMKTGWVVVLGLCMIAILLMARTRKEALKWAGWPLLLSGAVTLLIAVFMMLASKGLPDAMIAGLEANAPNPGPVVLMESILTGLFAAIGPGLLWQGGGLILLGTCALIVTRRRAVRGM